MIISELLKKIILIVSIGAVVGLAFTAGWFIFGTNVESKFHLFLYEFEWNDKYGQLHLRFESEDGAFTAGKLIHVNGIIAYQVKGSNESELFHLQFPNTLDPEEYEILISDEYWNITKTDKEIKLTTVIKKYYKFTGLPPTTDFDIIWTQEGIQSGYLIMGEDKHIFDQLLKPGLVKPELVKSELVKSILLENVITIQPSDVDLQIRSNNLLIGLTFTIIALTISTIIMTLEFFWHNKK